MDQLKVKIETLIVEDDKRIAEINRRFIEKIEGFSVIGIAYSGKEALEWVATVKPDLALLDVYLPDMLGTDLIVKIQETSPETDLIFITASSEVEIVKKAFRGGVADYILKPITFEKFKESLLTYKKKRESLLKKGHLEEDFIDFLWNKQATYETKESFPPKGIDPITYKKVINHLGTISGGITAEQLGKEIGVSRSTARRYLEYLVSEKKAKAELVYGTIGRPERRYFLQDL